MTLRMKANDKRNEFFACGNATERVRVRAKEKERNLRKLQADESGMQKIKNEKSVSIHGYVLNKVHCRFKDETQS